mmetsp:Transcript_13740/g.41562  ORF Transcript_13740/g.41562 Transcript_13740/m.41562 type:complete len:200 (-) Transcript_13740:13-612(-)
MESGLRRLRSPRGAPGGAGGEDRGGEGGVDSDAAQVPVRVRQPRGPEGAPGRAPREVGVVRLVPRPRPPRQEQLRRRPLVQGRRPHRPRAQADRAGQGSLSHRRRQDQVQGPPGHPLTRSVLLAFLSFVGRRSVVGRNPEGTKNLRLPTSSPSARVRPLSWSPPFTSPSSSCVVSLPLNHGTKKGCSLLTTTTTTTKCI